MQLYLRQYLRHSLRIHPLLSTPTVSKKPSLIPTVSPTVSQTLSKNPSITPTVSKKPSLNATVSPTVSQTLSKNPSITPTVSQKPSLIPSVSPTMSQYPSKNPSITPTVSQKPSLNPSVSPTMSQNPSRNPSITPTVSPPSNSPSVSPSILQNPSYMKAVIEHRYSFNNVQCDDSVGKGLNVGNLSWNCFHSGINMTQGANFVASSRASNNYVSTQSSDFASSQMISFPTGLLSPTKIVSGTPSVSIELWISTDINKDLFGTTPIVLSLSSYNKLLSSLISFRIQKHPIYDTIAITLYSNETILNTLQSDISYYGTIRTYIVVNILSYNVMNLYINDSFIESIGFPFDVSSFDDFNFMGVAIIGPNVVSSTFVGTIHEFRVWNGILSNFEIKNNFCYGPGKYISLKIVES